MSTLRQIRNLLPQPLVVALMGLRNRFRYRLTPVHRQFPGDSDAILDCCIAYNRYGGYCIPASGYFHSAPQSIYRGGIWEPATVEYIRQHHPGGDLIHAGTFFGDLLPAAAPVVDTLWAFEPVRESYRCAQITCLLNGLENVRLHNHGLGAERAEKTMRIRDGYYNESMGGGSRIVEAGEIDPAIAQKVEVAAIDDLIPEDRQVGTIHLDIEGFEQQALAGGLQTIERCRPLLIIETLPEPAWIEAHLSPLGYRMLPDRIDDNHIFISSGG